MLNVGIFFSDEVVIVVNDDDGEIFKTCWSFKQNEIWFCKPPKHLVSSTFRVGTLVHKGNKSSILHQHLKLFLMTIWDQIWLYV